MTADPEVRVQRVGRTDEVEVARFEVSNDILLIDGVQGVPRPALPGEVKRLGSDPVIILFETDGATVALAADGDHTQDALAPVEMVANGWRLRVRPWQPLG